MWNRRFGFCAASCKPPPQSILDVGAGNGYFTHYLDIWAPTTAVDYSPVILKANPAKNKKVMDARALTFPDNSFDLTFCHALLHHIDARDRLQVIREMTRVSKKYVAIIEPNRNNPFMAAFGLLKKEEWGLLRFSPLYVRGLAEKAGLRILYASSYGFLTPNRMPIPESLLSLLVKMEPFIPFGVTNIIVAEKTKLSS